MPGLARRLSPDRPARLLLLLRGLHPHHRLHVQPACKVAEGLWSYSMATADRLAQLSVVQPRLASGPQWLFPPGSRLHRPCAQQEGGGRAGLSTAGRQLPSFCHRPLPAQPQLRECRRRRQTTRAAISDHGTGGQALRSGPGDLAMGEQRPRRRAGRRDGLLRRRADAWKPWPRSSSCASTRRS